jgi:hypothetical protein
MYQQSLTRPFYGLTDCYRLTLELHELVTNSNPSGFCQHKSTFASLNNASYASSLATSYLSLFTNSTNIQADAAFQAALLIQPLSLPHFHASKLNKNPNMTGLEEDIPATPLHLRDKAISATSPPMI